MRFRLLDPEKGMVTCLVRDEMLQLLLRTKPATKDDWKRHIPVDLRLDTSGDEVQQYLERVLEITRRMAR